MNAYLTSVLLLICLMCSCAPSYNAPPQSGTAAPMSDNTPGTSPTLAPTAAPPSAAAVPEKTAEPSAPVPVRTPSGNTAVSKTNFDSIDNKGSGWGFKKNKGAEPDIYDSTKKLFEKYDTYYMDQSKPKALYLTFDEGYENGYTAPILDTLKKHNVPAAFFITGPYAKEQTELVNRMISEGHIIGNHTVNHPNLPKLGSSEKMIKELNDLNTSVKEKYGIEMKYMRPPEGEWSERLLAAAQSEGYKTILWSFAYRDWDTKKQQGADYAFEQVTPYLHDGAILLLHAVSSDNAAALERIIEYAKSQGYEFRSLDELKAVPSN